MSKYRILLEHESRQNVDAIHAWIAEHSHAGAVRWYRSFVNALSKLSEDPLRFPTAPEGDRFEETIRELTFRMRSGRVYRILFTVIEGDVHVLYVRAPGQDHPAP